MSTDTTHGQESTDVPPYNHSTHHGQPRWTHPTTGLVATIVADHRPASRELATATAADQDDQSWIFEVRPDGPNSRAEVYERLHGSREAAVARARDWLADHRAGHL